MPGTDGGDSCTKNSQNGRTANLLFFPRKHTIRIQEWQNAADPDIPDTLKGLVHTITRACSEDADPAIPAALKRNFWTRNARISASR